MSQKAYTSSNPLTLYASIGPLELRRPVMEYIRDNARGYEVERGEGGEYVLYFHDADGNGMTHGAFKFAELCATVLNPTPGVREVLEVMVMNNIHATNAYCQPYKHLTRLRIDADGFNQAHTPHS